MSRIMIVDDEKNMCLVLKMLFEGEGYNVVTAADGQEAIDRVDSGEVIDLVISDLKMPKIDGMGILDHLQKTDRAIPLVLITAYGTIPDAVQAMKNGAADFITKPFNEDIILHTVRKIFKMRRLEANNQILSERIRDHSIIFRSLQMAKIMEIAKKVATVGTPILLIGESGTGKELLAKAIHAKSVKAAGVEQIKPFARINCPAIPDSLFESELFGFQRGAFTGAARDYRGKIRAAENGTLFLDEIGELPLTVQPKLLRLLEDRTFEPLGSSTTIKMNCRFICATNRDLANLVAQGTFRKDLYYRINTLTITIPPLRERREDIMPLVEYFLKWFSEELGKELRIAESCRKAFLEYDWPGNVRELKNVVERIVVLAGDGEEISASYFPSDLCKLREGGSPQQPNKLQASERQLILDALRRTDWNVSRAARLLGSTRSNLRYRIRKYGLKNGE